MTPPARRVLLLGLGMQGSAALHDLVSADDTTTVIVADRDPALPTRIARYPATRVRAESLDARDDAAVKVLMRAADVVVEALPGPFARRMAELAVECGVSLVSSMYFRDPQETNPRVRAATEQAIADLARVAEEKHLVILSEFGLDPGLDLVLGVEALRAFDVVHEFRAYGAGIPAADARDNPLAYKFSWSPMGVLRSYRRPARIITRGEAVEIDATTIFEPQRIHRLDVPAIGAPLECFANGDAVHYAELFHLRGTVREMARYTGRLAGHSAFWNVMVKSGFLDTTSLAVGDARIVPMEFTAALLASQPQFQYARGEQDIAFIRVDVRGLRGGEGRRVILDLVDHGDPATGFTAMQRTVGFTLAIGARLILANRLPRRGLLTPLDVPYALVVPDLAKYGMRVERTDTAWPIS